MRIRHARSQIIAVAQPREDLGYKFLMMGVYVIVSAIIALWLSYLSTLAGSVSTRLNVPANAINRLNKGDQLSTDRFDDRWSAVAAIRKPDKNAQRIPFGCEGAFGPLVKVGNFSARCVAAADISLRLAAVE